MNQVNSINDLSKITDSTTGNSTNKTDGFKNIFNQAIDNVKQTEDNLAKQQYAFVTGQSDDTHTLGIAASEAQMAVDLLVSLRNKALDSYNELMRINL
jgi:flagellar hook-basal body complex protein FliE